MSDTGIEETFQEACRGVTGEMTLMVLKDLLALSAAEASQDAKVYAEKSNQRGIEKPYSRKEMRIKSYFAGRMDENRRLQKIIAEALGESEK